ncbi:MAG: hypothetical protein ABI220_05615 [Candidatus Saccharimonadales bacterium]
MNRPKRTTTPYIIKWASLLLGVILASILAYHKLQPYTEPQVSCISGLTASFPKPADGSDTSNAGILRKVLAYAPADSQYQECLRRIRVFSGGSIYITFNKVPIDYLEGKGALADCTKKVKEAGDVDIIPSNNDNLSMPFTRSLKDLQTFTCNDATATRIDANTTALNSYYITVANQNGHSVILFSGNTSSDKLPALPED